MYVMLLSSCHKYSGILGSEVWGFLQVFIEGINGVWIMVSKLKTVYIKYYGDLEA